MKTALIAIAITPCLLAAMWVEHLVAKKMGRKVYGHRQTMNNLAIGIGQRAVSAAIGLTPLVVYPWLSRHIGVYDGWNGSLLHWVIAFLVVDLAFYLRHMLAHRVAFLWALHEVHHQSHDFNFSAAIRLSWAQETIIISAIVAVSGMPLEMVFPLFIFGNLYQFLQHTELVGKLGVLDHILMTPSNHRVHHGVNPQYLDKNYGNVLVLWDKLFGTWEPEDEKVVFGVIHGLRSYDPFHNNVAPVRALFRRAVRTGSLFAFLAVLLMPPSWSPERGEVMPVSIDPDDVRQPQRRFVPPRHWAKWGRAGLVVALLGALAITAGAPTWAVGLRVGLGVAVVLLLIASSIASDRRGRTLLRV